MENHIVKITKFSDSFTRKFIALITPNAFWFALGAALFIISPILLELYRKPISADFCLEGTLFISFPIVLSLIANAFVVFISVLAVLPLYREVMDINLRVRNMWGQYYIEFSKEDSILAKHLQEYIGSAIVDNSEIFLDSISKKNKELEDAVNAIRKTIQSYDNDYKDTLLLNELQNNKVVILCFFKAPFTWLESRINFIQKKLVMTDGTTSNHPNMVNKKIFIFSSKKNRKKLLQYIKKLSIKSDMLSVYFYSETPKEYDYQQFLHEILVDGI